MGKQRINYEGRMRSRVDSNTASRLQPLLPDHVWRRSLLQHQATLWSHGPPLGIAMRRHPWDPRDPFPLDPRPQKQCILIKIEYTLLFRVFFWGTGCSRIRRSQIGPHAIRRYIWRQSSLQQKLRRRNPSLLGILRHPHGLKMTLKFFRLLRNFLHQPLHRRRLCHRQDR